MIKKGDTVLVPFKVLETREGGDIPYYLGYESCRINASVEMLDRWEKEAVEKESEGKTYEDGLDEAWELAKKIICNVEYGGLHESELEQIFGYSEFDDVLKNYTPQEVAAKIAEWESKQEICVGDILQDKDTGKEVVVSHTESREAKNIFVIFPDGSCGENEKRDFIKTGRTIDIEGLLAQIGGAE